MIGLILAAGKSTRIINDIEYNNKCLIIINNLSLIEHNLLRLKKMNIDKVIIVIADDSQEIISKLGYYYKGMDLHYIVQKEAKGIVNAIQCAKASIASHDIILCLADELLMNEKPLEMLQYFSNTGVDAVCGVTFEDAQTIRKNYTVDFTEENRVLSLIEKPKNPFNNYKGTGFCIFKNHLLNYLDDTPKNLKRQQYELCDWLQLCINNNCDIRVYEVADEELNINTACELEYAKRHFEPGSATV